MKNKDEIFWHDCEIEAVIEIPSKDILIYNIDYPEDWENNIFVPKSITFEGYYSQVVDEIPFVGNPAILSASVTSEKDGYITIKIETNAGNRFITAKRINLGNRTINT